MTEENTEGSNVAILETRIQPGFKTTQRIKTRHGEMIVGGRDNVPPTKEELEGLVGPNSGYDAVHARCVKLYTQPFTDPAEAPGFEGLGDTGR